MSPQATIVTTPARNPDQPNGSAPGSSTLTLADARAHWLGLTNKAGRLNAQRHRTDRLGYERAFKLLAINATGKDDLEAAPLTALSGESSDLAANAVDALLEIAVHKKRQPPGAGAQANVRSQVRALQRDLSAYLTIHLGKGSLRKRSYREVMQAKRAASKFTHRPSFPPEKWPPGIRSEIEEYRRYRTEEYYDGPGIEWRNIAVNLVRPITARADERRLNQYVRFLVESEGITAPTLMHCTCPERYRRFLRWYLGDNQNGGHKHAFWLGISLEKISRYLAARGEFGPTFPYAPDSKHPDAPWTKIVRLATESYDRASAKGVLRRYSKVDPGSGLTPKRLIEIGEKGFNTPPLSRNGARERRQLMHVRRCAATIAILLACLPVRLRNIVEMQHGLNLIEEKPGEYRLRYEGEQWKVDTVNGETFSYDWKLPKLAASAIDRWRRELEAYALEEHDTPPETFRATVPYVFPQYHPKWKPPAWGIYDDKAVRSSLMSLTLEVGGTMIKPHDFRRLVATDVAAGGTLEDAEVAAALLGNTRQTVLDTYFRPNKSKLVEQYHAKLQQDSKD